MQLGIVNLAKLGAEFTLTNGWPLLQDVITGPLEKVPSNLLKRLRRPLNSEVFFIR